MGEPVFTSRGRRTNGGIKASTTSMSKNEDGCPNEKSVTDTAKVYKSSEPNISTKTKKLGEKCHLPKKRFSYLYSQPEKLASSSKPKISVRSDLTAIDSSDISSSNVKYAENFSKPETRHCSLSPKRKCQPPKKRYSHLYSQSEDESKRKSYTSLKSNSNTESAHRLTFGDLSLVESIEKTELYKSNHLNRSDETSNQIPRNEHNYLHSLSEPVSSDYVSTCTSLNSNFDTEYAQGLSSRSFSHVVSAESTEELNEINPMSEPAAIIIYAEKTQIPGYHNRYLYSQPKDRPSSFAKSYTALPSNFGTNYSQELSSGEFTLVESVRNTAGVYDTHALDLSARPKKSIEEVQILENQHSSSYYQTGEALPSSTKSYRTLDSYAYSEKEHVLSSGIISLGKSTENESEMLYLKDLTDAEREERRKEQSKRRSEKYRLNCQEKMKQLGEEFSNLQEKNKALHAEFDKLKRQWDKLLTISPCFTGKCETFKPLNEIKKRFQESGTVLKEVESDEEDKTQMSKCKCKGHMRCESNKCSCYKNMNSCTPRCHKNYSCRNH